MICMYFSSVALKFQKKNSGCGTFVSKNNINTGIYDELNFKDKRHLTNIFFTCVYIQVYFVLLNIHIYLFLFSIHAF